MHLGFTLWFTGLSGAGKTTLVDALYKKLTAQGFTCVRLDGDELRRTINADLGFSREDRRMNIVRTTYISELLSDHGIISLVSLISPYKEDRQFARSRLQPFVEIYVKCPLEVCIQRDVKGLYKRAMNREVNKFTGVSDPYEEPIHPEITIETNRFSVEECLEQVLSWLEMKNLIQPNQEEVGLG